MRKVIFGFLLVLCLVAACRDRENDPTRQVEEPTKDVSDSIRKGLERENTAARETAPAALIKKAAEIQEEKKDSSPFRREGCCDNEAPPAICCCDAILISYKEILTNPDKKYVAEIRSKDPFLNDCYKLIPDFKKQIDILEMGE